MSNEFVFPRGQLISELSTIMKEKRSKNIFFQRAIILISILSLTLIIPSCENIPEHYKAIFPLLSLLDDNIVWSGRISILLIAIFFFYASYSALNIKSIFSKEAIQLIGFEKLGIHINHTDLKSSTNRIQQRKKNESQTNVFSPEESNSSFQASKGLYSSSGQTLGNTPYSPDPISGINTARTDRIRTESIGSIGSIGSGPRSRLSTTGRESSSVVSPNLYYRGSASAAISGKDHAFSPGSSGNFPNNLNNLDSSSSSPYGSRYRDPKWNKFDNSFENSNMLGTSIYYDDQQSSSINRNYRNVLNNSGNNLGSTRYSNDYSDNKSSYLSQTMNNSSTSGILNNNTSVIRSWQNSPIDKTVASSKHAANSKTSFEAFQRIGIDSMEDRFIDSLKKLLASHLASSLKRFDVLASELIDSLRTLSTPESTLSMISELLHLRSDCVSFEPSSHVHHPDSKSTLTLSDVMENLSNNKQAILQVQKQSQSFKTPTSFGMNMNMNMNMNMFSQNPPPNSNLGAPVRDIIGEYEKQLELFILAYSVKENFSSMSIHNRNKDSRNINFSDEELSVAVEIANRMRELSRDNHLGRFKWTSSSPEKSSYSNSKSTCPVADSEILIGIFLHYCNSINNTFDTRKKDLRFSDIYIAEDESHVFRHLKYILKRINYDSKDSLIACITRTSTFPLHFNLFVSYPPDDGSDSPIVEEWKVNPGRQNVFLVILTIILISSQSDYMVTHPAFRELFREIFDISGQRTTNDSIILALQAKGFSFVQK